MKEYLNTGVYYAHGSQLAIALDAGNTKLASTVFKQTTAEFERLIPNKEDRSWLMSKSRNVRTVNNQHQNEVQQPTKEQ